MQSYILRVVEQRVLSVQVIYELHDIASGTQISFKTLAALRRHLDRQRGSSA